MSSPSPSNQLSAVNQRLKAGQIGVTIIQKGNRLYLRGTLPPRPGSDKDKPHQQEIALGIEATSAGMRTAEKEARKVGGLLSVGEFSWWPYLRHTGVGRENKTIGEWVSELEKDYFIGRAKNPQSISTWKTNYVEVYSKLPLSSYLSKEILMNAIVSVPPSTRMRQKVCMALDKLVEFADFKFDAKRFSGDYSPTKVQKRNLPSDEAILFWYEKLSKRAWQWCFGMIATYGLRPHEVFHLDLVDFQKGSGVVKVLEGKTGERKVWPLHPEWVQEWSLMDVAVPNVNAASNKELGHRVCQYFRRQGMEFKPYDLRHAWAARSIQYGLEVSLAAKQMGHSVAIHIQTYHAWIDEYHYQQAYERLLSRSDRPLPPQRREGKVEDSTNNFV
ncbi:site-specific integrase [Planktothrix sp. FACHB-1355]|uniref:tyrosine-type recombinase/integrase n=1 Tax=Planktothrix sp. FACHB-1355 TaxID=2692854 RepID=UPI00168BA055|nr:tyrosine-type recombinase/integrase [Planktothrix sp. FACHB-1355]MBD3561135.1 site-specific integrase [Planktothrix sp. FACHB-1355]